MDKRKIKSQQKLQEALVLHLQNKPLSEITIGELTKTAGVSRQTFYANFSDKQSVLLSRIDELVNDTIHILMVCRQRIRISTTEVL